jgi:thioredoxin 1
VKAKILIIAGVVLVLVAGALSYLYFGGNASANTLASVNGEKITVERFSQEIEKIQEPNRSMFKEDPAKFLEMMIMKALLLQELRKQGSPPAKEDKAEDAAIQEFLQKKFPSPPMVSREEVVAFYEMYKDRMEGKPLEQLAPMIEQFIGQQKQEEGYGRFLEGIRNSAAIEINQERLKGLAAKPADASTNTEEEFAKALGSGRPVLVDFGSNSCIPCRQLRPILQEIRKEQEGKLEVLVIDIYKHQALAGQYRIQVIPTLVFFDSKGNEMFRHQGFKPKTALMEELKRIGIG